MNTRSREPLLVEPPVTGRTLLRNRNFVLLWAAYGISAFGDHLSELGLMRELQIEHSSRQVQTQALMTFLFFVPFFSLGWLTGVIADRLPRRAVMIGADLARAAIVLSLPIWVESLAAGRGEDLQQRDLLLAMLPLMALGLFAAVFSPARQALLPQLVRDDQLVRANSISSGLGTIAAMLSNMVGGVLAAISPRLNFLADAGTFLASAILLGGIRIRRPCEAEGERAANCGGQAPTEPRESFGGMVLDGLRYVRSHRRVMELILLASLFWSGAGIFTSVLPSVVFERFDLGYEWVGWMRGALAGGMFLGAIVLTTLGDRIHGELVNLIALVGAGLALIGFGWAPSIGIGMVMAVLVGVTGAMLLISVNTMLQRIVPNRSRGRVFGVADMATMAGLLAATGLLGLWTIPGLDRHVSHVLAGLGIVMAATGLVMHGIQSERSGLGWWFHLLRRLNQFVVRWWYRLERAGPGAAPIEGPAILAANHTSYIDPMLLYATCSPRLIHFMVAKVYMDMPVLGWFLRGMQCIATTRSGQDLPALRQAMYRLEAGGLIGVFPQGRIEVADQQNEPLTGIALLALRSGAPVIPVHISGTYYHSERPVWTFLRRHRAVVRYGKPVDLTCFHGQPIDRRVREEATRRIWSAIQMLAADPSGHTNHPTSS